jgi:hypothetical protein
MPVRVRGMPDAMDRLIALNIDVCSALLNLSVAGANPLAASNVRLVHPMRRNGTRRISEQEARFLYAATVERRGDFWYSVETPTVERYSFSSKTGDSRSAQSDLSLYSLGEIGLQKDVNVEFKENSRGLDKDFEKLVREGSIGHWFHFPANARERTLPRLQQNLRRSLASVLSRGYAMKAPMLFTLVLPSDAVAFWDVLDPGASASQVDAVNAFFDSGRPWTRVQVTKP